MAIEASRGCGYRKVGGLYICGGGMQTPCDRLPYPLGLCPVCGSGVKFTRGWTWINWKKFAGNHSDLSEPGKCVCGLITTYKNLCPVCNPGERPQPFGLLWVGESSYTLESFSRETAVMGVSRRIPAIPRGLKLGQTVVLLVHRDALGKDKPGVFEAFTPQTLELLIWESEATEEKLAELVKRGITPIIIPDGDKDHNPDTKQSATGTKSIRKLSELRNKLKQGR